MNAIEMALHDYAPLRTMAFGMAGHVGGRRQPLGDQVRQGASRPRRDRPGDRLSDRRRVPEFGNNDNRVDQLAVWVVSTFMSKLRKYPTYRNALHTQSVLTITSNVVYGKATGNTPDGRRQWRAVRAGREPDARPGQPWHSRLGGVGRENSVSRCGGRHLAHGHPWCRKGSGELPRTGSRI